MGVDTGVLPAVSAEKGLRTAALLQWLDGPTGAGIDALLEVFPLVGVTNFQHLLPKQAESTNNVLPPTHRLTIIIEGDINEVDDEKVKDLLKLHREKGNSININIDTIDSGSINIHLVGDEEGLETLKLIITSAQCSDVEPIRRSDRLQLQFADLRKANLEGADLKGADLKGADLRDADLRDADLKGADLKGADLKGADLKGADLKGADLKGADLRDADFKGADLRDADLRENLINIISANDIEPNGIITVHFSFNDTDEFALSDIEPDLLQNSALISVDFTFNNIDFTNGIIDFDNDITDIKFNLDTKQNFDINDDLGSDSA